MDSLEVKIYRLYRSAESVYCWWIGDVTLSVKDQKIEAEIKGGKIVNKWNISTQTITSVQHTVHKINELLFESLRLLVFDVICASSVVVNLL